MFQIPNSKLLIWTLKKEGNFITVTCNHKLVYKYDFVSHSCTELTDFKPKIKFRESYDTASIMYKIILEIGKIKFQNARWGYL